MYGPYGRDDFNWQGCAVVRWNPKRLGGRGTVRELRMDADGILVNFESGSSVEEIVENFAVDREAVEAILKFAAARDLRAIA